MNQKLKQKQIKPKAQADLLNIEPKIKKRVVNHNIGKQTQKNKEIYQVTSSVLKKTIIRKCLIFKKQAFLCGFDRFLCVVMRDSSQLFNQYIQTLEQKIDISESRNSSNIFTDSINQNEIEF